MNSIERLAVAISDTIQALDKLPIEECEAEVRLLCELELALDRRAQVRAREILTLWEQRN